MELNEDQYLAHYGILRRSGRYPWGSGSTQNQRNKMFLDHISDMKRQGMTDVEIAKAFHTDDAPFTLKDLRALKSIARSEQKASDIAMAEALHAKGWAYTAIGRRMGKPESTVRTLLAPGAKDRADATQNVANMLRKQIEEKGLVDVGSGVENHIGVTENRLNTALSVLKEEGYVVRNIPAPQISTGYDTRMKVLAPPGTTQKEVWQNREKIRQITEKSDDNGRSTYGLHPPIKVNPKRVDVVYGPEGGKEADGVIYVRRGVDDISLGGARYAQVRIAVGDGHYLKGMAMYKDDLPDGVDLQFHTSKDRTPNKLDAMKTIKDDPENPFGSVVNQIIADPGSPKERVTSAMNIVHDEGEWATWSRTLSSQFLSKQNHSLVRSQLAVTKERREQEFDDLSKLTNPVVRKKFLDDFAGSTDSAAVHLKAAQMPRQGVHVILPIHDMKPSEVYAPNFADGETVVLVRHPHGGTFEIPELRVNNSHPTASKYLGQTRDAIGIHHSVAQRLSGADFDGDTVLVIPNNERRIKTTPALEGLKNFDPKSAYPGYPGMKPMRNTQAEMGLVSNLITDMSLKGATNSEKARAIRHSMVVIDAEKHELNYKLSYERNGIRELREKYQRGAKGGADTLISTKKSRLDVPERQLRKASRGGPVDRETGRLVYEPTGRINRRTGLPATTRTTKLGEATDARALSSGTPIENLYADYSNDLKGLANQARLKSVNTPLPKQSPSARKVYAPQVKSLEAKLDLAEYNRPLERQAQLVAHATYRAALDAHPDMDKDSKKKIRYQALEEARRRTGANKQKIKITSDEWNAIQAGAISAHKLSEILRHADMDIVRDHATPKRDVLMTPTKIANAKQLFDAGYTRAQIAQRFGVSLSTLDDALTQRGE